MIALKLAKNNLKRFFLEKNAIFIYIILPVIILGGIIEFISFESKVYVYVCDQDKSELSQRYINYLKENKALAIKEVTLTENEDDIDELENIYTKSSLEELIKDFKINMYINIEEGFEDKFYNFEEVKLKTYALSESETFNTVRNMNDSFFSNTKTLYLASGKDVENLDSLLEVFNNKEVALESKSISENNSAENITYGLGILIYFILLASIKICKLAVDDKTFRVYHRIFSMPVSPKDYILGYVLSTFSIVLLQILLSIATLQVLGIENVPVIGILITLSIFSICAISISLLIIAVVNNQTTIEVLTSGVAMFTTMLSGIFWPIELMPEFMQKLAMIFPQYWAYDALKDMFFGRTATDKSLNFIIIGCLALLFFGVAIYLMRTNDDLRDA